MTTCLSLAMSKSSSARLDQASNRLSTASRRRFADLEHCSEDPIIEVTQHANCLLERAAHEVLLLFRLGELLQQFKPNTRVILISSFVDRVEENLLVCQPIVLL